MREQLEITLLGLQSVSDVRVTVDGAELSASGENPPPPVQDEPTTGSVQVGIDSATGDLAYFQGMSVGPVGGPEDNDLPEIARVWRAGCIIRSAMLNDMAAAPAVLDRLGLARRCPGRTTRAVPGDPGMTQHWILHPDNPQPRLFRLVEDRALVNRMGFNNDGAAAVTLVAGDRLAALPRTTNVEDT